MSHLTQKEYDLLTMLLNTESPSSAEEEISQFIKDNNKGVPVFEKDAIGNSYLFLKSGNKPTVMIAAHCDEIGLQVVYISDEGYVRFRPVGGIDVKAIVGQSIHILAKGKKIPGVICKAPIHLDILEKKERPIEISDLWIDIGCSSYEETKSLISIGDMVCFAPNYTALSGKRLSSKALDNKLGVFIAMCAIKRLSESVSQYNTTAAFTVQEEVGGKGAIVAAKHINPQWGICIDAGVASDCPGIQVDKYGCLKLGMGPGLQYSTDTSRLLIDQATKVLEDCDIPYQKTVGLSATGGTDTWRMQVSGNGVPCILLSIPIRSMHTPCEICDLDDVSAAIEAVVAIVTKIHDPFLYD